MNDKDSLVYGVHLLESDCKHTYSILVLFNSQTPAHWLQDGFVEVPFELGPHQIVNGKVDGTVENLKKLHYLLMGYTNDS